MGSRSLVTPSATLRLRPVARRVRAPSVGSIVFGLCMPAHVSCDILVRTCAGATQSVRGSPGSSPALEHAALELQPPGQGPSKRRGDPTARTWAKLPSIARAITTQEMKLLPESWSVTYKCAEAPRLCVPDLPSCSRVLSSPGWQPGLPPVLGSASSAARARYLVHVFA